MDADVRVAETDEEIAACWTVMHELRTHISSNAFARLVRAQQKTGYFLVYAVESEDKAGSGGTEIVAVAGARVAQNLAWGRFLYIDDLAVREDRRSRGYGSALLAWLLDFAGANSCREVHLDSGMERKDAHRFYEREGLERAGIHFRKLIELEETPGSPSATGMDESQA